MNRRSSYLPAVLTLALIGGLGAETLWRPRPADAEPHHQRVRLAAAQSPLEFGDWKGVDTPVPPAAIVLLKPNVIISRQYHNRQTGRSVNFLLVHCKHARDLAGHYPPVCYPAHGWRASGSEENDWLVAGRLIPGTEYDFYRSDGGRDTHCTVSNLMVLPGRGFARDMKEVRKAAADYLRQFYGAAQIQVVMDAEVPADERQDIVRAFLEANLHLIEELRSGG
jgi:hypothetical protein